MGRSRCDSDTLSTLSRQEQEPEPEPYKKISLGLSTSARKTDLPKPETDRESILDAIGVDRVSGLTGKGGSMLGNRTDMAEVERWLDLPGITVPVVLEEVRRIMARKRDGPPSNFKFFTSAMQRLSGELSRPPLNPNQPIERTAQ